MREHIGTSGFIPECIELIRNVPSGNVLTLSGGEPGLLRRTELDKVLEASSTLELNLNTNGTFLRRYPEHLKRFNTINLHLDPLDDSLSLFEQNSAHKNENETQSTFIFHLKNVVQKVKRDRDLFLKVNLVLIATKTNQDEILRFCAEHKRYKFDIIPSSHNTGEVNEFTCFKLNPELFPFMSATSLRHYFLKDRYRNVIYLN